MKLWLIRNNRGCTDNPRTRPSVLLKLYSVMPDYPARLRVYSLVRESQTALNVICASIVLCASSGRRKMEICVGEVFTTSSLYYNICETEKTDKADKVLFV